MNVINNCSQYYPHAGKKDPCGGRVHDLTIKWIKIGEYQVPLEPVPGTLVCDDHMQSFIDLGNRKGYQYSIVTDVVVGEIEFTSEEGKPHRKEQE